MKPNVRRVIAYIAARLILRENLESIYDYTTSQHYRIAGIVDDASLAVYDYSCSCDITGKSNGSRYSLFHFGESTHITLSVFGHKFKGFDFGSGCEFDGVISGRSVTVSDSRDGTTYRYAA
jgi:hypothetical protein